MFLFCLCNLISEFLQSWSCVGVRWNVNTHENERTNLLWWIEWLAFLDLKSTSTLTQLHLNTTSQHGRFNALASFSQVSIKHRAAEFEKSLFVRESRRRSSVLLGRGWRFARMIFGIKYKIYNFDPFNVFWAISTNIPVLLYGIVLQGHIYIIYVLGVSPTKDFHSRIGLVELEFSNLANSRLIVESFVWGGSKYFTKSQARV